MKEVQKVRQVIIDSQKQFDRNEFYDQPRHRLALVGLFFIYIYVSNAVPDVDEDQTRLIQQFENVLLKLLSYIDYSEPGSLEGAERTSAQQRFSDEMMLIISTLTRTDRQYDIILSRAEQSQLF